MKSVKKFAIIAAFAVALTACSTTPTPGKTVEKPPFNILWVSGVTGALASNTQGEKEGAQIAIDEVNAKGGILGRKIALEVVDDKSNPTEAVTVLQKRLASGTKPDLIRVGNSSPEALAMLPIVTRAGIASYTVGGAALLDDPKAYPLFKTVSSGFTPGADIIEKYVLKMKYKHLVVFIQQDAAGDSELASAKLAYANTGVTLEEARYNAADVDLSVPFQRAIRNNPDAIYAACIGATCPRIVLARGSSVGGTDIPMIGSIAMSSSPGGLAAGVPPELIKNLFAVSYTSSVNRPSAQSPQFAAFYKKLLKYGTPALIPNPVTGYDGIKMFAAAAAHAKSTDGAKMIAAIDDIKWKPGDFITWGKGTVDYTAKSTFPKLSDGSLVMFGIAPQKGGLYPPDNIFIP
jgi:branched-chain amino acid transport system substrate-binding protein